MAEIDSDVIIVGGEDTTIVTVEHEVHIVTVETPVEIQSDESSDSIVVEAVEENSIATEEEVVHIVSSDEDPVIIADIAVGPPGGKGADGLSAYDVAVAQGFIGTEIEWLASLVGEPGPPGQDGSSGTGGSVIFITDVSAAVGGIVANKIFDPDTVPANAVIDECTTDRDTVTVFFGCSGPTDNYSPTVTINGIDAVITESSTKRWFVGSATIPLVEGENLVTAVSSADVEDTCIINLLGGGPSVLAIDFGHYPGAQTELKAGDVISVTVTTEPSATHVTLVSGGAQNSSNTHLVTDGTATFNITINSATGNQPITVKARNEFGTYGSNYASSNLVLNQTNPTFGSFSVVYQSPAQAMASGSTANVSCVVNNYSTIAYSSSQMTIPNQTTYSATKTVTNTHTGYVATGTNYTITATRAANNATASASTLVKIATTAPTAVITTSPAGRMVGSPTGVNYTVTISPTQKLIEPPTLNASHGSWSGSWTASGNNWTRTLVIHDSTLKGTGTFSNLTLKNEALISGSTITSGSTYTVGGFTSRTVTFPAFSRVAPLGTSVSNQAKTSAQFVGGAVLVRYTDNDVRLGGYYIANADGSYNATGSYIGLSDTAFAGSNTSGTLQVLVQEVA